MLMPMAAMIVSLAALVMMLLTVAQVSIRLITARMTVKAVQQALLSTWAQILQRMALVIAIH